MRASLAAQRLVRLPLLSLCILLTNCAAHKVSAQSPSPATPAESPPAPVLKKETWVAKDQKELPYRRWPADRTQPAEPKAVVIFVHGLSGAASDFWPAGDMLQAKGLVCYGIQLRGQGNDPDIKSRGDISSYHQWVDDLYGFTRVVKAKHPGLPTYWYGESLGSLIVIKAAELTCTCPEEKPVVDGLVFSSPVVSFREKLGFWKNAAVRTLMAVWPGKKIALEDLGNSEVRVTKDTTHKQQMSITDHYVSHFTVRLMGEVEKMVKSSDEAAAKINLPALVLYTPHDVFTSKDGVEHFYDELASKEKSKAFFEKSYHLILHDVERETAVKTVDEWFEARVNGSREFRKN